MKICQYCNEKISWFGGVDHTKCNAVAETHKSNIHAYIKKSIIAGNFNIKNTPAAFKDAEQFLTASEVENAIAFGYDDAVRHIIDDALVDDKERKNWDAFRNNLEINLKQSFAEVSKWLNIKVRALISLTKHNFISSSWTREIEDSMLFFDSDVVVSGFLYLFFAFMIPLIFS